MPTALFTAPRTRRVRPNRTALRFVSNALASASICLFAWTGAAVGAEPEGWHAREFELGVAAFGMVQSSALVELSNSEKVVTAPSGQRGAVLYPGFIGVAGGGGASVTAMWRGFVGLELQAFYSVDRATGTSPTPIFRSVSRRSTSP